MGGKYYYWLYRPCCGLQLGFIKNVEDISNDLQATIDSVAQSINILKKESGEKDHTIKLLKSEIAQLKITDELEQQGRKDSIRIFGLHETGPGSTDQKVLDVCNKRMRVAPLLQLDEIAISHRVGPENRWTSSSTTPACQICQQVVQNSSDGDAWKAPS